MDKMLGAVGLKPKIPENTVTATPGSDAKEKVYTAEEQAIIDKSTELLNEATPMMTEEAMTSMEPGKLAKLVGFMKSKKEFFVRLASFAASGAGLAAAIEIVSTTPDINTAAVKLAGSAMLTLLGFAVGSSYKG
ncbi:MAG: hypothetical protein WCG45_01155 [bacterium]